VTYPLSYLEFRNHLRAAMGDMVDALTEWKFDGNPNLALISKRRADETQREPLTEA
jgi:hypothetical protein